MKGVAPDNDNVQITVLVSVDDKHVGNEIGSPRQDRLLFPERPVTQIGCPNDLGEKVDIRKAIEQGIRKPVAVEVGSNGVVRVTGFREDNLGQRKRHGSGVWNRHCRGGDRAQQTARGPFSPADQEESFESEKEPRSGPSA